MKLINLDTKKGEAKIKIENLDDLWYLSHITDVGDYIKGKTIRKVKIGEDTDRKKAIIKKPWHNNRRPWRYTKRRASYL
jgi:stalled ribosome rescue protein Dom34